MGCGASSHIAHAHVMHNDKGEPHSRGFVRLQPGLWRCQLPLLSANKLRTVAVFLVAPEASAKPAHLSRAQLPGAPKLPASERALPKLGSARRLDPLEGSAKLKRPPSIMTGSLRRLLPPPLSSTPHPKRPTRRSSNVEGVPGWTLVDAGPAAYGEMLVAFIEHVLEGSPFPTLSRVLVTHPHSDHVGGLRSVLEKYPGASVHCHPHAVPLLQLRTASPRSEAAGGAKEIQSPCLAGFAAPKFISEANGGRAPAPQKAAGAFDIGIVGLDALHPLADREPCGLTAQTGRNLVSLFTPGHTSMCVSFVHRPSHSLLCGDVFSNVASNDVAAAEHAHVDSELMQAAQARRSEHEASKQVVPAGNSPRNGRRGSLRGPPPRLVLAKASKRHGTTDGTLYETMLRINNTHFKTMYPSHDSQAGVDCADVGKFVAQRYKGGMTPTASRSLGSMSGSRRQLSANSPSKLNPYATTSLPELAT